MSTRSLQKWHGAGNDFLIDVQRPGEIRPWSSDLARALCQRATGVGADGLLVALLEEPVAMTLFNADGSLAEMSGNGARCLAAAVRRDQLRGAAGTSNGSDAHSHYELNLRTGAGPKVVRLRDAQSETSGFGSVDIGEVTFADAIEGSWGVANVGNPHVVVFDRDEWNDVTREELAAKMSAQVGGANVEFVTELGPSHFALRVVERGVGWTLACGTGSCAVAALAARDGRSGDLVTIENPGGTLRVQLEGKNAVLSGPVQFVADVEWPEV